MLADVDRYRYVLTVADHYILLLLSHDQLNVVWARKRYTANRLLYGIAKEGEKRWKNLNLKRVKGPVPKVGQQKHHGESDGKTHGRCYHQKTLTLDCGS